MNSTEPLGSATQHSSRDVGIFASQQNN